MRGARETQEAHGSRRSRAAVGEAGGGGSGLNEGLLDPEHIAPVQSGRKAVGAKRDSSARDPVAGGGEGKEGVAC